jgi:hypothetical protein
MQLTLHTHTHTPHTHSSHILLTHTPHTHTHTHTHTHIHRLSLSPSLSPQFILPTPERVDPFKCSWFSWNWIYSWIYSSGLKTTGCSSMAPEFSSQHPQQVLLAPGDLTPWAFMSTTLTHTHTHIYIELRDSKLLKHSWFSILNLWLPWSPDFVSSCLLAIIWTSQWRLRNTLYSLSCWGPAPWPVPLDYKTLHSH